MDEIITLIKQDMPEGRQSLKDSFVNLEKVAEYCEDSYMRWVGKLLAAVCTLRFTLLHCSLLPDPTTSEPPSKRRKTSQRNRSPPLPIRSTLSLPTTSNCSICKRIISPRWNRKWTTSHKRSTFTRRRWHDVKSAFSQRTRSHRDSTKLSHPQIPRSPSSMYANRSITAFSTRSVTVCIMANRWQRNAPHNSRRFSPTHQCHRQRQSHRRRLAWAQCVRARRWSWVAREQSESRAEANIDRQLRLFRHKCRRIMLPTIRSGIRDVRTAIRRRTVVDSSSMSDRAIRRCRRCNKCHRTLCFIPIIPIHSFFIHFSISNRITMIVHQALTCLVRIHIESYMNIVWICKFISSHILSPAPPSPLTITHNIGREMPDQNHIGLHTLSRNSSLHHQRQSGSSSPPLPPPPEENADFGRPRVQSLQPIVPDDQNLPGWVPKNYIEKGKELKLCNVNFEIYVWFSLEQLLQSTIIMLTRTTSSASRSLQSFMCWRRMTMDGENEFLWDFIRKL